MRLNKVDFFVFGSVLLIQLVCLFLPYDSLTDFGPVVNGEDTYISADSFGFQSAFVYANLVFTGFFIGPFLFEKEKSTQRGIVIAFTILLLVWLILHHIGTSIGQNGGPFIPHFYIGYKLILASNFILVPYSHFKAWSGK